MHGFAIPDVMIVNDVVLNFGKRSSCGHFTAPKLRRLVVALEKVEAEVVQSPYKKCLHHRSMQVYCNVQLSNVLGPRRFIRVKR